MGKIYPTLRFQQHHQLSSSQSASCIWSQDVSLDRQWYNQSESENKFDPGQSLLQDLLLLFGFGCLLVESSIRCYPSNIYMKPDLLCKVSLLLQACKILGWSCVCVRGQKCDSTSIEPKNTSCPCITPTDAIGHDPPCSLAPFQHSWRINTGTWEGLQMLHSSKAKKWPKSWNICHVFSFSRLP